MQAITPQQLITVHQPSLVRLTLPAGDHVVIRHPRLVGDTIVGSPTTVERETQKGIPLSQVQEIATRRVNALKTGLLIGGTTVTALAILVIVGLSGPCAYSC